MIDNIAELAQLQIEQNLGRARHDALVTYQAADLEEENKVQDFVSTGCEWAMLFTVHTRALQSNAESCC